MALKNIKLFLLQERLISRQSWFDKCFAIATHFPVVIENFEIK